MKKPSRLLLFLQGFIMLNLLWWAASRLIGPRMVPSPASVYLRAGNLWADGVVLHLVVSLWRAGAGLVLALVIGSALGLVMAHSSRWNRILHPLVYLTYPIPKTALLPVLLLLFGLGDSSKILLVTLIVIFQVIVSVRGAALSIPREHYHHITSLGAGPWQRFRHVTLPAILPELFTNTKVSVGTALSILFFSEGYGTDLGIGYYILDAWGRLDYPDMYGGIVALALLGFALFAALDALEGRLCRWQRRSSAGV